MVTWAESRGSYAGTAELWAYNSKLFDVEVALTGFVNVVPIKTMGSETDKDTTVSWNGVLLGGISEIEQNRLLGQRLELHLPTGKVGNVVLTNNKGSLRCTHWPPFPIEYNGTEVNDESEITT